jgi:phosphoglycerol transferase MdoB-like AlkP superfamily enzyme
VAGHCSIAPHSERDITTTFTYTALVCLPAMLRQAGWHTAYFTGSDPDWDNQTVWLRRWYDEREFYRDAGEDDRVVFHRAAERIRALGRSGTPFFATVVSITNHYPFYSRDHAFDLGPATAPAEAVRNTMHYTDAVVREFVGSLSAEPWLHSTLLVVVGDHGYNLGEHDGTPGQRSAFRESVWVPLVIAGPHPALPRGRHPGVASLLDIAPTLAELLGIRQPGPWLGRSLLHAGTDGRTVSMQRFGNLYAENDRFALVVDPASDTEYLFDPMADLLEARDIAPEHPEAVRALRARAEDEQRLIDYLVEADRMWPGHATP